MTTKQVARIYKALSNENRLEIFLSILQYEQKDFNTGCDCIVTQLMSKLCIGAPTISHHLKELTDAGLITTEKQGKYLVARVNQPVLDQIRHQFDQIK
ncbi:MAG: metalloregulator ArsR/SmtB family transcription factor [bacterium]|nr:metalloregulator ArsR/SmtB family transcription factor [bacterium]